MHILNNSSSEASPVESFIDFVSNLKFNDVLQKESVLDSAAIIKVGDMTYRVMESEDFSELTPQNDYNQSGDTFSDKKEGGSYAEDLSTDYVPPLLHLHIVPVQPDVFLAQLPHHLSSFIQELVSIVKQYNVKTNLNEFHFQFKRLNLDIMLSKQDELLKIVIQVGDKSLQQELNSERQKSMVQFLSNKLDSANIDVEFDFLSYDSDQSGGQQSQSDQSNQEESDDQETNSD